MPVPSMVALACYLPLHSLPGTESLLDKSWSPAVTALLTQQVREPLEERLARSFIPHLIAVADEVSLKVKQQYEENPYPRWVKAAPAGEPASIRQYFGDWFKSHPDVGWPESIDILVAGCGTGQNLVETARQFKGARVLAVDLSVASLCYAKRQALALGLTNIAFAQADILELASIDRKFDIVDASGVLHHLANPWTGWRVLLSLLRPNSFMRVGLYSKLARADVNAARVLVSERGYAATVEDIRRSRQDILALPDGEIAKDVANSLDFFTISECRDMLFHVREYQMTLSEIGDFIAENGIEFLGFIADASFINSGRASRTPTP